MQINLNGKNMESNCRTLMDLVQEQRLDITSLVAELNFKIIKQAEWNDTLIKEGDTIELLSFVGGG